MEDGHWVRWHAAYDDPGSALSQRLAVVKRCIGRAIDAAAAGPVRLLSLCAGQGRDVVEVLAEHPRREEVVAYLIEMDPQLVEDARALVAAAGLGRCTVVEADASSTDAVTAVVPTDVLVACGIFGNISDDDVAGMIAELPHLCAEGATVIWTRHRRPPDLTPAIRSWFDAAGFDELSFESPEGTFAVGANRLRGPAQAFRPDRRLFSFVGDGTLPS